MKKTILAILICVSLVLGLTGCENKYERKGTDVLKEHGNVIFSVSRGNKDCVTIQLTLYDDNQYELFTDYATCKKETNCTLDLEYTKSIKGTYDYNIEKIIEASTNANDKSYSMDNLPEYELHLGQKYVEKYDTLTFTVEKEQTNQYLNELLEQLNIDLDLCAIPDYIK